MNPTGTEARVCADIAARQAKGTAKYGTTVQDNPLGLIQWLQHAYEECLDQAVYLKRVMELMQGVEAKKDWFTPSDDLIAAVAEMDVSKNEGADSNLKWLEENGRRHEEALLNGLRLIPEPTTPAEVVKSTFPNPADPHAELKAIYRPGMRWRLQYKDKTWSGWYKETDGWNQPNFNSGYVYEIHPEDLPKPQPKEEGWITVPYDCMEMPEGLSGLDRVDIRLRNGRIIEDIVANTWGWRVTPDRRLRIIAYRKTR